MSILARHELRQSPLADLHALASELGIEGFRGLRRDDLIEAIVSAQGGEPETPTSGAGSAPAGAAPQLGGEDEDDFEDDEGDEPAPLAAEPEGEAAGAGADPEAAGARRRPRTRSRSRGRSEEGGRGAEEGGRGSGDGGRASGEGGRPPRERGSRERNRDRERDPERGRGRDRERAPREREDEDERLEGDEEVRSGILDVLPNGSGFMRVEPFVHSREDVYVSPAQIRRCELRAGDELSGPARSPRRSERYPSLVRVDSVNGSPAEPPEERPDFEELTAVFASSRLPAPDRIGQVPFGRGSRVAIGGPPGAGATTLLREIVEALRAGAADLELTVVLSGVRPEEVTEWRRMGGLAVAGGAFDRPGDELAQVAAMAVERAKRIAERGRDAAIVVDSLDALPPAVGRKVFGAARNSEEAGSLTVIASTGTAGELQRLATTRIVLEPGGQLGPASGTLRGEALA